MEKDYSFDLSPYKTLSKVGSGPFGIVYKVIHQETNQIFAAKVSHKEIGEGKDIKDQIRNMVREVNIMSKLNHPSIVKFIGYSEIDFEGKPKPVLVTEYIPKGSLSDLINSEHNSIRDPLWDETHKLISLYGIASAMGFLHSHNIIHRDLKPDNILMDENLYPKIADFGLSKFDNLQTSVSESTTGFKGTMKYSSPEMILNSEFSPACDVYAYSIIAYEILTSEDPYKGLRPIDLFNKLVKGERPKFESFVPDSYQNLIERCCDQVPEKRPTFLEITEELAKNPDFITELVDEAEFLTYVDFINECEISFNESKKILSYKEYLKNKKLTNTEETSNSSIEQRNNEAEKLFKQFEIYYHGRNGPIDMKEALKYCKLSAEKGHVDAMYNYALMLEKGEGHPIDNIESNRYYKMAADKGHIDAMFHYGKNLEKGIGVSMDKEAAMQYYKMASDKGQKEATNNYAMLLYEYKGSTSDKNEAKKILEEIANSGSIQASFNFAQILSESTNQDDIKNLINITKKL